MNSFSWTSLSVGVLLTVCLTASVSAGGSQLTNERRDVLRMAAEIRVAEMLQARAIRNGNPRSDVVTAGRIAATLDDDQLLALSAGRDAAQVLAGKERYVASDELRAAVATALGDSRSELLFVPIAPCRIVDTRVSGGILDVGQPRAFQVAGITEFGPQGGTLGGCGVPAGGATPEAAAVALNFVAVGAQGPGHLRAWATATTMPEASVINYSSASGLNIANGVIVPIAGTNLDASDLEVRADVSPVHVVIDVTGYFTRFPIDEFARAVTVTSDAGAVDLSSGACVEVNACTLTSPVAGKAVIRVWSQITINHGTNVGGDRISIGLKNVGPTNCNADQSINANAFEVADTIAPENGIETTLSHKRIFTHLAGTRTYYANARVVTGAGSGDGIQSSRLICTFIPD